MEVAHAYIVEQHNHEMKTERFRNYQSDMLWNVLRSQLSKTAKMPPTYREIQEKTQPQKAVKKVTKQSVRDMFLAKQEKE